VRLTALNTKGAQGKFPSRIEAVGKSIPAPVWGWDALNSIANMPPDHAFRLINWFPQPGYCEIRRGHIEWADTGTGLAVETLATYTGISSRKMFAASGSEIFDVTLTGMSSSVVSGLGSARWQYINFATSGGNFLYMVNGVDPPEIFDGAAWSNPTITGISSPDIIGVNAHKNRLWFTMVNSSTAYYLPVNSIQGAASAFPLGGLWSQGGYLMAMGTWSIDGGTGLDDYAVFISSRGQVAIYNGTDPSSSTTWSLVGVFDMGAPIGRRCFSRVGADLAIISIDGIVPLSRSLIFTRAAVQKVSLSQNILRVMSQAASDYFNNFGWEFITYPRGNMVIINVPQIENDTQVQFVMNALNGSWCMFEGMNSNCWELLNELLYFGGNNGIVYQADTGGGDPDLTMRADMMTAYNYYGDRGHQKRWMMCRPLITTDQRANPGLAFNVDFQTDAEIDVTAVAPAGSALWDVALWDVGEWAPGTTTEALWDSVTGIGYCASIRLVVDVLPTSVDEITLQVNGFDLVMETGAFV
jgi:hypothetical protein